MGAHRSRDLSIPGVDLDGVYKGIDFLLNVNLGYKFTIGKKVIVIGGGNVAMDVARSAAREVVRQHAGGVEDLEPSAENVSAVATKEMVDISLSALRMGAREVNLVCLERREEMPAALEEIVEAEEEGIIMHPGLGPKRVLGKDGKVTALESAEDQVGLRSEQAFQSRLLREQRDTDRVRHHHHGDRAGAAPRFLHCPKTRSSISPRGLIAVNPQTLMTSAPGIFAGGDCVFGPRLIIDSVGDGKRAAVGIDEYLRGGKHPEPIIEVEMLKRHAMPLGYLDINRQPVPMLPLERRTGVTEVEIGYDAAARWPRRSAACIAGSTRFSKELRKTAACASCVVDAWMFVRKNAWNWFRSTESRSSRKPFNTFATTRNCFGVELDEVQADELGVVTGAAMLKDETRCIRCGFARLRCPVGTITMESYNLIPAEPTGLISIAAIGAGLQK